MAVIRSRYGKEGVVRRGDEVYERDVRSRVGPDDEGEFVVLDVETGALYEIGRNGVAASDRLLARYPDAQVWRSRHAHRFGLRRLVYRDRGITPFRGRYAASSIITGCADKRKCELWRRSR